MGVISINTARTASKVIYWAKKHAPEIWLGIGIITGVGATGMAIKATVHVEDEFEDHRARMDAVHEKKQTMINEAIEEAKKADPSTDISEETVVLSPEGRAEIGRATMREWLVTGGHLLKRYASTIGLMGVSITSYLIAHGLLKKRYLGVVAAFGALQTKYDTLAGGVAKEYGVDTLHRLERGEAMTRAERAALDTSDPEKIDGEAVEELTKLKVGYGGWTSLDRLFDETSPKYDRYNAERNRNLLLMILRAANAKLARDGWLELNWVYTQLGFKKTKAGHVMGWLYDPEGKGADGPTGFVDFGLITEEEFRQWIALGCDGTERTVPLHFGGVGFGLIYDKLPLEDI